MSEQILEAVRYELANFGCPAALIDEKAIAIVAHPGNQLPPRRLMDIDGQIRVVDALGIVAENATGAPQSVRRFVADYVYYHPKFNWTVTPLCE